MTPLSYSIPDFVAATGVGRAKLYEEIKAGRLKTIKCGSRTLVTAEDGRRWLELLAAETAERGEAA